MPGQLSMDRAMLAAVLDMSFDMYMHRGAYEPFLGPLLAHPGAILEPSWSYFSIF